MPEIKHIVITGASSGIGYATALSLSKNANHRIFALARNSGALHALSAAALGGNIVPLAFDVRGSKTLNEVIGPHLGNADIDVLINNAGHLINKPFTDTGSADWEETFAVNVFGTVNIIRSALPVMGRKSRGHIVNIGSMGGFQGSVKFPGLSAYSASKAAIMNLTENLAQELTGNNIAVNCLAFGAVQTEMLSAAFPGYQAPVTAAEMADFVAHFALVGATFFNGKIIPVSSSTP